MTLIRGCGNEYSWKSFVGEAAIAVECFLSTCVFNALNDTPSWAFSPSL